MNYVVKTEAPINLEPESGPRLEPEVVAKPGRGARVVVVSNRVSPGGKGESSAGGLAVAMDAMLAGRPSAMWFGWSGTVASAPEAEPHVETEGGLTRMTLDLPEDDYRRYYNGFSNAALWPLFHYHPDFVTYRAEDHAGYLRINERFADVLAAQLQPGDLVWVHDYHLIPLGQMLRERGVANRMGFFLHIPFPCPEILTTLPVHASLVRSLFAYDLVGFQTSHDVQSLADYVTREAGGVARAHGIMELNGLRTRAGAFPVGIDPEDVAEGAKAAHRRTYSQRLRGSLNNRKLMIGVDRLDYTKGLVQRFKGLELLMEEHPEHRRDLVTLQIAPPSRGEVPEYQRTRATLDQLIGRLNGRFGEPDLLPVRYLNRQFARQTLFGFYRESAVGLVTSLRDGMNLVAQEYLAAQNPENPGVLVCSRFAGAAELLADSALIVNPFDPHAIADAMHRALIMPKEERIALHRNAMEVLRANTVANWAQGFMAMLARATPRKHGTSTVAE